MFQKFYPDLYISSTYEIDFDRLYRDGYRGLIFDIDNTLVTHGAPANEKAKKLFAHLHELGFATLPDLQQSGTQSKTVCGRCAVNVYLRCTQTVHEKTMKKQWNGCTPIRRTRVFIGDQMFTDVFGANRTGIPSIMVKKIHWKEEIQIVLKRRLEAIVLISYRNYRKTHRSIFENREEEK